MTTEKKCTMCNDTGVVKYKPIEELMYSWVPLLEKKCDCPIGQNYKGPLKTKHFDPTDPLNCLPQTYTNR